MLRKSFLVGLIVSLGACAQLQPSAAPPQPKIIVQVVPVPTAQPVAVPQPKSPTSPWIGKKVDDVITVNGQPTASVDMGNNVRAFQFQSKPKKPKCVASYLAIRDNDAEPWIVQEYIAPDPATC